MINVEPTVEVINEMADKLEYYAGGLRQIANLITKYKDLSYAADAIQAIKNMNSNLRTDLLVTRPLREYRNERTEEK